MLPAEYITLLKLIEYVGPTSTLGFAHAFSTHSHESHFRSIGQSSIIHLHAAPPFLPALKSPLAKVQVWRDPACDLQVSLTIDWFTSIGKLVLRYRAIVAAWPMAIVLLCFRRQLVRSKDALTTFTEALNEVVQQDLPRVCGFLTAVGVLQTMVANLGWTAMLNSHNLLLGNDLAIFWPLAPIFLFLNVGLVYALHILASTIFSALAGTWTIALRGLPSFAGPRCVCSSISAPYTADMQLRFTNKRSHRLGLRIATFGGLIALIALFAPHQFAFLVLLLLQGQTVLRSLAIYRASEVSISYGIAWPV